MTMPQVDLDKLDTYLAGTATNAGTGGDYSRFNSLSTYDTNGISGKPFHAMRVVDGDRGISQVETFSSQGTITVMATVNLRSLVPGTVFEVLQDGEKLDNRGAGIEGNAPSKIKGLSAKERRYVIALKDTGLISLEFCDGTGTVLANLLTDYLPIANQAFTVKMEFSQTEMLVVISDENSKQSYKQIYADPTIPMPAINHIVDYDPHDEADLTWYPTGPDQAVISGISDSSGNGYDLTANNSKAGPIYNTRTIGGYRALNFDRNSLATDDMAGTIAEGVTVDSITTFVVMEFKNEYDQQVANNGRILQYDDGNTSIFYKKSNGDLEVKSEGNDYLSGERVFTTWENHVYRGEPFLLTVESLRDRSVIRINGSPVASQNRTTPIVANGMQIDGQIKLGNQGDIQIARCVVSADITTSDRDAIEASFMQQYHLKKETRTEDVAALSPDLVNHPSGIADVTQGATWDGRYIYTTSNLEIVKWTKDWIFVSKSDGNPTLMPGMDDSAFATRRHMSGIDVIGDELYIAYRTQTNDPTIQYIIVFGKDDLIERRTYDISATCGDASGLGYNPRDGLVYIGGFTTRGKVWVYDTVGVFQREINLSHNLEGCQGLAWHRDRMYIAHHTTATAIGRISSYDSDGSCISLVVSRNQTQEAEGIFFKGDTLCCLWIEWFGIHRVHQYPAVTVGDFEPPESASLDLSTEYGHGLDADFYSLTTDLHLVSIDEVAEASVAAEMLPIIKPYGNSTLVAEITADIERTGGKIAQVLVDTGTDIPTTLNTIWAELVDAVDRMGDTVNVHTDEQLTITNAKIDTVGMGTGGGPNVNSPIPLQRTFVLEASPIGLIGESKKTMQTEETKTYALDFTKDVGVGGYIFEITDTAIQSGVSGGIISTIVGVNKASAVIKIQAITAGEYTIRTNVVYSDNSIAEADIKLLIVDR